jgi:hypothetical protein
MKSTLLSLLLCTLLALASAPAAAADSGRIDLAPLAATLDAKPRVNINFGPAMMAGFAETLRQSSPDLAEILQSVTGLRLMVFENVDSTPAQAQFMSLIEQLDSSGWTPALKVDDDDTLVDLYLNESGQLVKGMVLLVRDGKDTVVMANIHGDLDAVSIGKLIGSGKMMGGVDLGGLMGQFQGNGEED